VNNSQLCLAEKVKAYEAEHKFRINSDNINIKHKAIKGLQGCIAAGRFHTVGVQMDGLVVAVGRNKKHGQRNIDEWRDILAVSAGDNHTIGLCLNGTVVATGNNEYGQCDIQYSDENKNWRNITAISAGANHSLGIKHAGLTLENKVISSGKNNFGQCDTGDWRDIIEIAASENHSVGLHSSGKVLAVGNNEHGQLDVECWTDIISISAGFEHTVGLRADGLVIAVGGNNYGKLDVENWNDIIAISAGAWHTVGLRANGTVVAVGSDKYGQLSVGNWSNIVAIAAGRVHTVGLKQDGTVIAVGAESEYDGRSNVANWLNIGAINRKFEQLMEEAGKHIGKPYLMGANGPDAFDCSSFVSWVYTRSGVYTLSRQQRRKARDIYNLINKLAKIIPFDNRVRGDLIFFRKAGEASGDEITHVGIYVGNNVMLHAGGKDVNFEYIDTEHWNKRRHSIGRLI